MNTILCLPKQVSSRRRSRQLLRHILSRFLRDGCPKSRSSGHGLSDRGSDPLHIVLSVSFYSTASTGWDGRQFSTKWNAPLNSEWL